METLSKNMIVVLWQAILRFVRWLLSLLFPGSKKPGIDWSQPHPKLGILGTQYLIQANQSSPPTAFGPGFFFFSSLFKSCSVFSIKLSAPNGAIRVGVI